MMENKRSKEPSGKLIMDQTSEQKYLLHYTDLSLYILHGMKIKKLQTVHQYSQTPWLAEYFKYNAHQRAKAETKFEKTFFYKLTINPSNEKLTEKIRKRINLDLIDKTDSKKII